MSNKPIFLVTGGTGAQGGSIVKSLLKNGKYHIRVLTRNSESENAKKLKEQGVEVVKGNISNHEDLKNAFKGVEVVFALTNYWDPTCAGKEEEFGKGLVDAAIVAGVKHFIWSTLPYTEKLTNGRIIVPHCDGKARVDEYILSKGLPATFIIPGFYFQNFQSFFHPKKEEDGTYVVSFPDISAVIGYDVEDTGEAIVNIAQHRNEWLGKYVRLIHERITPQEYVDQVSAFTGKKVKLVRIPLDVYAKLPFPGAEDLAAMYRLFDEYNNNTELQKDQASEKLNPNMKTYKKFLEVTNYKLN